MDNVLITPPLDGRLLQGVTRGAVLDAAQCAGVPAVENPLDLSAQVDELYLSSTLKELAPVVALDGAPAPGAGPIGKRVRDALRTLIEREC